MILYYTPRSPYARIARITMREAGLADRVAEELALLRAADNPVLAHMPLGRVPTLVVGEVALTEASRIHAYLAELSGDPALRQATAEDPAVMALEGLGIGLIEAATTITREARRAEGRQEPAIIPQEREKIGRCLAWLDAAAAEGRLPDLPVFGAITLACGVGYIDYTGHMGDWSPRFPALARWFWKQKARPSVIETAHPAE